MTPDQRRAIVIANEGNALSSAGHHGPEGAAEFTRLSIDGLANALVRMEGAEVASAYAFALADRVAGGLREPTDWRMPIAAALPPPAAEPLPTEAPRSRWQVVRIARALASMRPPSNFRWSTYLLGVVHGAIALSLYLSWRWPS